MHPKMGELEKSGTWELVAHLVGRKAVVVVVAYTRWFQGFVI